MVVVTVKVRCSSACVLLTEIRVDFLPVHGGGLLANVCRTQ